VKRYERPAVASAEIARTPDGGLAMCLTDLKPGEGKLWGRVWRKLSAAKPGGWRRPKALKRRDRGTGCRS